MLFYGHLTTLILGLNKIERSFSYILKVKKDIEKVGASVPLALWSSFAVNISE